MGVFARGPHISLGHRSDGGSKLFDNRLGSATAFANVAILTATEADVVKRIHVIPGFPEVGGVGANAG